MICPFAPHAAATGRTLFRIVFRNGDRIVAVERYHLSQEQAEDEAPSLAASWAPGQPSAVILVYPCPGRFVDGRTVSGGP